MDTRSKILSATGALAIPARPIAIVSGTFDVLRAAHAREIEEARARSGADALLVVVLPRAGALLPQSARAELVAALRAVDYVVMGGLAELEALIRALAPVSLVRLEETDERLCRELREQVLARHQA